MNSNSFWCQHVTAIETVEWPRNKQTTTRNHSHYYNDLLFRHHQSTAPLPVTETSHHSFIHQSIKYDAFSYQIEFRKMILYFFDTRSFTIFTIILMYLVKAYKLRPVFHGHPPPWHKPSNRPRRPHCVNGQKSCNPSSPHLYDKQKYVPACIEYRVK